MSKKAALLALIIGALMFVQPVPAFAEQAFTEVTCAKGDGEEKTFAIGWDNSDPFFEGKGDIPRLYCEGGYSQPYNFYVSDNLPADSPLRWYNGIAPTTEPEPEPSEVPLPSEEPTLEPEPSLEPSPSPTMETPPIPAPQVTPEITLEPTPAPADPQTPSPEPTLEPQTQAPVTAPLLEPTPTPTAAPEIVETPIPEPTIEPTPLAAPIVNPQVQTIELPEALQIPGVIQLAAAAEAVMNVGADMSDEKREEAQIIAIAAIIVSQIAGSIRRNTK
jgi:hypothetical protein